MSLKNIEVQLKMFKLGQKEKTQTLKRGTLFIFGHLLQLLLGRCEQTSYERNILPMSRLRQQ